LAAGHRLVKQPWLGQAPVIMGDKPTEPTREERLAAQLRANLKRRKAQARALKGGGQHANPLSKDDADG